MRALVPALAAGIIACCVAGCGRSRPAETPPVISPDLLARSVVPSPEAAACAACHPKEVDEWRSSQHAHANRLVQADLDGPAFAGGPVVDHAGGITRMAQEDSRFLFTYAYSNEPARTFEAESVIAISPLRQYLVRFPGGRLQVMDTAYDPRSNEWFNAFGDDRFPGEWGHWTGRAMTWNVQCAFCHMTGFEKRYDPAKDVYNSTWKSMGIACSQCHTLKEGATATVPPPATATNECPLVVPFFAGADRLAPDTTSRVARVHLDNCASCHARREELFGSFKPGDRFEDHFRLVLPDQPGIFQHDGQVLDEDFEYASFMMSRMGHKGVTCLNCHNPHSGKLVAPVENNALCMQCHTPPGLNGATPIVPDQHMFHTNGTPGGRCIDCHMPENTYMVRDNRRDHGFTSPDPRLTIEFGIPNACNRCHVNQTPEWSEEWTEKWYGDRMDRRARHRARAVAVYHEGSPAAVTGLLAMAKSEEIDAWRAALVAMLAPWSDDPAVAEFVSGELRHPSARVRSSAVVVLAGQPSQASLIEPMRDDPSALVRIDAAMNTIRTAAQTPAYAEVMAYLRNICDQPAGALRQANVALVEGRNEDVGAWTGKMTAWDPAAPSHYMAGRLQFAAGLNAAALSNLVQAALQDLANADYSYAVALAMAEAGYTTNATAWLENTVRRDAEFGRAWYNLGLAYAGEERLKEAVMALKRAEALMTDSADPSFARATIHARLNQPAEAIAAAQLALARQPGHPQARAFLQSLKRQAP